MNLKKKKINLYKVEKVAYWVVIQVSVLVIGIAAGRELSPKTYYSTRNDRSGLLFSEGSPDEDFKGSNLTRSQFFNANLKNADFSGTLLDSAGFVGSELSGANFSGAYAKFSYVVFRNSCLRGARFKNAYLEEPRFYDSDLRDTDFSGSFLHTPIFKNSNLCGARFEGTTFRGEVTLDNVTCPEVIQKHLKD